MCLELGIEAGGMVEEKVSVNFLKGCRLLRIRRGGDRDGNVWIRPVQIGLGDLIGGAQNDVVTDKLIEGDRPGVFNVIKLFRSGGNNGVNPSIRHQEIADALIHLRIQTFDLESQKSPGCPA